jgi:ubiquinone/menaquinone biosynthesis C-methylase UbiE
MTATAVASALASVARCSRCKGDLAASGAALRCAPCALDHVEVAPGVVDLAPEIPPLDQGSGAKSYDREAVLYDAGFKVLSRAFFSARHARFRAMSASAGEARRALDMPTGTGLFLPTPSARTEVLVALDLSAPMLERARRVAIARGAGAEKTAFVRASAHGLPFKDGAFDAVLCLNGLHVFPEPAKAVREIRRVLAPGGRAFIATLVAPRGLRGRLGAWILTTRGYIRPPLPEDEMRALLAGSGLVADEAVRKGEELYFIGRPG